MKITHSFDEFQVNKNVKDAVCFILTNKIGGYCYLANRPTSRYQGVFFNDNFKMYKVIENIRLINTPPINELKNNFFNAERKRGKIIEYFFMPYGFNSMIYGLNHEGEAELMLDIRESYSNPEFGRFYEIFEENGKIVIKYRQDGEFECYLVISGCQGYEKTRKWFKQHYELDKQRNSAPYEKYIFSALKMRLKQSIFSFSFNKEDAIRENEIISKNLNKLKNKQKESVWRIINKNKCTLNKIKNKEMKISYICALNSLNNLVVKIGNEQGIFASLPWFFQFWARDEAVALGSLKHFEKKSIIKKILLRLVNSIKNGRILNKYPGGNTSSNDSLGWILKRAYDFDMGLLKDDKIKSLLTHLDDNLALNNKKESWMDTLDREGARIEIQALKLFMLKSDKKPEIKLKDNVIENFWNGKFLKDGINDETIRPNMFIAAYIYPELLTNREWATCFEYALSKLWLRWGGLSTIDKSSPLFCPVNSGENTSSYHNGDSWFWINNLAAITLYRTHKNKFSDFTGKIVKASKDEILWKGAIGHHAELSSASQLSSEGCVMQAWSAAMFIELFNEIKNFNFD